MCLCHVLEAILAIGERRRWIGVFCEHLYVLILRLASRLEVAPLSSESESVDFSSIFRFIGFAAHFICKLQVPRLQLQIGSFTFCFRSCSRSQDLCFLFDTRISVFFFFFRMDLCFLCRSSSHFDHFYRHKALHLKAIGPGPTHKISAQKAQNTKHRNNT